MATNRLVEFVVGNVVKDRKTEESLGVSLSFQDANSRMSLDRWYFWGEFDEVFSKMGTRLIEMRANPGTKSEPALMTIFMPSTRKDEEDSIYCLVLNQAERLFARMSSLKLLKPEVSGETGSV